MNPRSKEKLLMTHHGCSYGEGVAFGYQFSLRQGAGTELLLIPISGSRWRRKRDVNWKKESSSRVFGRRGINRCKVGHRVWPHLARRPEGAPPSWPRQEVTWPGGGPPPAHLRASGVFREIIISGFFLAILIFTFSVMHKQ